MNYTIEPPAHTGRPKMPRGDAPTGKKGKVGAKWDTYPLPPKEDE